MRRVIVISAFVVLAVVAGILIIGGVLNSTGNIVNVAEAEYGNQKCVDGDGHLDYEKSLYIKSNVTVKTFPGGRERGSFEDECSGSRRVQEYVCTNTATVRSRKMHCLNGCSDGACVR
jgi:hypothetical protein